MIKYGRAVCYSGYRGETHGVMPTEEQIKEDLLILDKNFDYLRVYSPGGSTILVLKLIRELKLHLKVMLGVYLQGEISNYNCPWGGLKTPEEIAKNIVCNNGQVETAINLANEYSDIVCAVSAGNESIESWSGNQCSPERVVEIAKRLKAGSKKPVTFCSSAFDWNDKMKQYQDVFDIISIHSYPVWQKVKLGNALDLNINDYKTTCKNFPNAQVVFTECGWPTLTNEHSGMVMDECNEEAQKFYLTKLWEWTDENKVICFVFSAFDEIWKGSTNPTDPEKHWGIYNIDRTPKLIMK